MTLPSTDTLTQHIPLARRQRTRRPPLSSEGFVWRRDSSWERCEAAASSSSGWRWSPSSWSECEGLIVSADLHWGLTLDIFLLGFCWEFGMNYWDKYGILSEIALFFHDIPGDFGDNYGIFWIGMISCHPAWCFFFHLPIGLTQQLCYCRAGFKSPINQLV